MIDIPPDLRVTMADVRDADYCAAGARRWFELHNLDFRAFIRDGMNAREFVERGDAHALDVVTRMLGRG